MTYLLPTAPITTETEALRAGRASAIAIFIGVVVVGIIGVIWTLTHPEIIQQAIAQAEAQAPGSGAIAESSAKFGQYFSYAVIAIQLGLGYVQWRSPNKVIAYIFLALIALGFLLTAATPMLAGLAPNAPAVPAWQIILSLLVMVVQFVLHITGVKGISKLDQLQLASAR